MSRRKLTDEEREAKLGSGSKEAVLANIGRYMENPDKMMVSHGVANNALRSTDNMNIAPSKMYADEGHKMDVVRYLAHRSATAKMPRTKGEMFDAIEAFLQFCGDNKVPPTIGGFSVWCGVTVGHYDMVARDKSNAELAHAAGVAREIIRNFLEIAAMDGSLNPIVYFHNNKVYYGAVENQTLTIRTEDNTAEISDDEYRERVIMLQQGEDGVYRAPEEP